MNSASRINFVLVVTAVCASMYLSACSFENLGNSTSPDAGATKDGGTHSTTSTNDDASKVSDSGED